MIRVSVFLTVVGAAALVLLGACGKRHVTKPTSGAAPECRILSARSHVSGPVTFALLDPVDLSRAPWAIDASERMVFGHLYETLIVADCAGEVRPGLAETWTMEEGGLCWTFDLRKDARFWDGSRVTARDVVESWQDALTLHTVIDSASAVTDRRLRVWLGKPHREVPRVFSASVFAVTKPSGDSRWLMGSGPYRVGSLDLDAFPSPRRTITVYPAFGHAGPVIRFVETSTGEARDLLESTIDVIVTTDPAVIDYAANRPRFVTLALPWDKTYALLSTSRVQRFREGGAAAAIPSDLLDGLARDAVRGAARGYQPPSWWDNLLDCGESEVAGSSARLDRSGFPDAASSPEIRRILYDARDPVARGLAERIAALAAVDTARSPEAGAIASAVPDLSGRTPGTVAQGVTQDVFERSLRRGDEFAYVVLLPRQVPDPCHESRELNGRAPWLAGAGLRLADVLVPLADTRSHLIVREGAAELFVDGYGGVLVTPGTR